MRTQRGSTFIEIIVVIVVFSTLFGIITVNLLTSRAKVSLQGALSTFLSDVQEQQVRAISFDAQGAAYATDYGVYFTQGSYTLFKGSSYSVSDPDNFVVTLDEGVEFSSITVPSSIVVFSRQSGEVTNFDPSQRSVTIKNTQNNEQKTIQINRYGVITSVN